MTRAGVTETHGAIKALVAQASSIQAHSMTTAVLGACDVQTIRLCPARLAHTERGLIGVVWGIPVWLNVVNQGIIAHTVAFESTVTLASSYGTCCTNVKGITHTFPIVAFSMAVAILGASLLRAVRQVGKVVIGEFICTLTIALHTNTIRWIAMLRACVRQAVISHPTLVAFAHSAHTLSILGCVEATAMMRGTCVFGAIESHPANITVALAFNTCAVV